MIPYQLTKEDIQKLKEAKQICFRLCEDGSTQIEAYKEVYNQQITIPPIKNLPCTTEINPYVEDLKAFTIETGFYILDYAQKDYRYEYNKTWLDKLKAGMRISFTWSCSYQVTGVDMLILNLHADNNTLKSQQAIGIKPRSAGMINLKYKLPTTTT